MRMYISGRTWISCVNGLNRIWIIGSATAIYRQALRKSAKRSLDMDQPSLQKEQRKYPKLRKSARGETCVMCDADDETIILAHCNMPGDFGVGLKGPDWWAAYLCYECHIYADGHGRRDYEWWRAALYRTHKRFISKGLITIGG